MQLALKLTRGVEQNALHTLYRLNAKALNVSGELFNDRLIFLQSGDMGYISFMFILILKSGTAPGHCQNLSQMQIWVPC